MRNRPYRYEEEKERINFSLTPTAQFNLKEMARTQGISRSELIERIGRGIYTICFDPPPPSSSLPAKKSV